eukprot:642529-Amphidinium_carterae.1
MLQLASLHCERVAPNAFLRKAKEWDGIQQCQCQVATRIQTLETSANDHFFSACRVLFCKAAVAHS